MVKYFIIITIICNLAVSKCTFHKSLNVGSVLFADGDAAKGLWTLQSVELLKARKHFQRILVPLLLVSEPLNDKNLHNLLKYLNNVYAQVYKSSPDDGTNKIMQAAVSDVIGGFLKFYVLPVTKYAYYGGVVTPTKVDELNRMYEKIQKHLNTDGSGWRNPNQNMLDNIVIDVASPPWYKLNNYLQLDPCKKLGYFEKTATGLLIPMPNINWNRNSYTMFLPLKNESLVSLLSIDAFNLLFKYYNAAKECAAVYSSERKTEFEDKFQTWLVKDVVPHLSDDIMYPGLAGVLTLMNIAKFNDNDLTNEVSNPMSILQQLAMISGIKVCVLKKLLVILILVWICIPASIFLYCQRKFKKSKKPEMKKPSRHRSCVDVRHSENYMWNIETLSKTDVNKHNKRNKKSSQNNTDPIPTVNEGVMTNITRDASSCTHVKSKDYLRICSLESSPPSDETIPTTYSDISQSQSHYTTPCPRTLRIIEESQDSFVLDEDLDLVQFYNDSKSSYIIEPTKTVTLFRSEREKPRKYSHSSFSRTVSENIEAEALLINSELISDNHASSRHLDETVNNPFLFCINEVEVKSTNSSFAETSGSDKTSIITSRHHFPTLRPKPTVEICLHNQLTSTVSKPEVPPKALSVDGNVESRKSRPSKIPKWSPPSRRRMPSSNPAPASTTSGNQQLITRRQLTKSKLPTRRIQDDTAIKTSPRKKDKLNITL